MAITLDSTGNERELPGGVIVLRSKIRLSNRRRQTQPVHQ
jgi:hypothetical protein